MDADLARVARGLGVSAGRPRRPRRDPRRGSSTPATIRRAARGAARRGRADGRYYEYEEPRRGAGRSGRGCSRCCSCSRRRRRLPRLPADPGPAPGRRADLRAERRRLREALAVGQCSSGGLESKSSASRATTPSGLRLRPDPGGRRAASPRDRRRHIFVSTGPPTTEVPDVSGRSRDDAVAALDGRRPRAERPTRSTRTSTQARSRRRTRSRARWSRRGHGPDQRLARRRSRWRPVRARPALRVGRVAQLAGRGLRGGAERRETDQPAGTVVDADRPPAVETARGRDVTLSVSKGPTTVAVPDVTCSTADTPWRRSRRRLRGDVQRRTRPTRRSTASSSARIRHGRPQADRARP